MLERLPVEKCFPTGERRKLGWLCHDQLDLAALEAEWRQSPSEERKVIRVQANEKAILNRLRREARSR